MANALPETESITLLTELLERDPHTGSSNLRFLLSNSNTAPAFSAYSNYDSEADGNQEPQEEGVSYKHHKRLMSPEKEEIRADLIFTFIKDHMTQTQVAELRDKAQTLGKLLADARALGQVGFSDELLTHIAQVMKEQEFLVRGFSKWFSEDAIRRFRERSNVRMDLTPLDQFPRPIPAIPAALIKNIQEAHVFDHLVVLHMNPTGEQARTFSERIKQKDPILFGATKYDTSKLFYITDWIDEVCDLSLDKMLVAIHDYDADFKLSEVGPVEESTLIQAAKEAEERLQRLSNARPATYREDLAATSIEDQGFSWRMFVKIMKALWRSRKTKSRSRGPVMGMAQSSGNTARWR